VPCFFKWIHVPESGHYSVIEKFLKRMPFVHRLAANAA